MTSDPTGERLQKVLAHAGLGSRRAIEELIAAGRVRVNGDVARLGRRIDPGKDKVEVDGSAVPLRVDLEHHLANKPPGVIASAADTEGRPTVLDLVDSSARLWPVGRLDVDSEGAILVTNDGDLTHRLTHPRYEVPKTYIAYIGTPVASAAVKALARGVELDDGPAAASAVRILERSPAGTLVEITIAEGRNRQVRRMFDAVGHRVVRLVRVSIGPLRLGRLAPGSARRLTLDEVRALYRSCGM